MNGNLAEDQRLPGLNAEDSTDIGHDLTVDQCPLQLASALTSATDVADSDTAPNDVDADENAQEPENKAAGEPEMTAEEKAEAFALLRDPDLLDTVKAAIGMLGHVGEAILALIVFLVGLSCRLGAFIGSPSRPLNLIVKGESSIGKSHLIDKALACIPPEWKIDLSSMSAKALVYMTPDSLKNKVIVVAEHVGGEASDYFIRILQSEGVIRHAVTVKNEDGDFVTELKEMEGPIALIQTTTLISINPENETRLLSIHPDDSPEQTKRIIDQQKQQRTYDGLTVTSQRPAILRKYHNALRQLKIVEVVIDYAPYLQFEARTANPRVRRDFEKLLNLITVIAFFRQCQKEIKALPDGTCYVEADIKDYRIAYELASVIFQAALDDLPPKSRELLSEIKAYASRIPGSITRRGIRDYTKMPEATLRKYIKPLEDNGYLTIIDGGFGGKTVTYDSNIDTRSAVELGLISPEELSRKIKAQK